MSSSSELSSRFLFADGFFNSICSAIFQIFNQVGVVAINLLGENTLDVALPGHTVDGWNSLGEEQQQQPIGSVMYPSMGGNRVSNGALDDLSFDMNLDPDSAQRIRQIVAAKENAVNKEDYDAAKRLKAAEGELCG